MGRKHGEKQRDKAFPERCVKKMKKRTVIVLLVLFAITTAMHHAAFSQQENQQASPDQWPKTSTVDGTVYTIYQPQLDDWDGYRLTSHAAVSVLPQGAKEHIFGVINFSAKTHVERAARTVHFKDITVEKANFPSSPDSADKYQRAFHDIARSGNATMTLDHLQAAVAIISAQQKANAVPVKNTPPTFIFSQLPALLVNVNGDPVWINLPGTSLKRILNTRAFIACDTAGTLYMHLFDGFVSATNLKGPWQAVQNLPQGMDKAASDMAKQNVVDLMVGEANDQTKQLPSLKNGVPSVFIATVPTELVVTEGAPDWQPISPSMMLLYVKNTTGDVFKLLSDQSTYVLVTGRWFKAPDFAGPWQYVPGSSLPPEFARIPDESPKENVKASIPGTPQAQEALIANQIPQTATVTVAKATFAPVMSGGPQLKPIDGTPLSYVVNSATPIIKVNDNAWYACQNGVWFTAASLSGPWAVATSVPPVIYSIPTSSPLHYVTYLKVYDSTQGTVDVGYTPGYMGTSVTPDNVVVYGTGYDYDPYIGDSTWYSPPITYGYAANPTWTPWTGWAIGFGVGWAASAINSSWGWGWGAAPYWGAWSYGGYRYAAGYAVGPRGAAAWGPNGWAATSGNIYHQWGTTGAVTRTSGGYNAWTGNAWSGQVGHSYNSVTGQISAGQRGSVQNVYNGNYATGARGATYNPRTGASAAGSRETIGNANTGRQETVGHGEITGPGGQTTHVQEAGNHYYAERNGNVYKDTGNGFQQLDRNGSWNNVTERGQVQTLQDHQWARSAGNLRSASSSWGGDRWGGGGFRSGGWGGGGFRGGFGGFRGGRR
jgi:hypothetical protein